MDSVESDVLIAEILKLRKGPGVTLEKLRESPSLITALSRGCSLSLCEIEQQLVDEIQNLGDGDDARALRNALNLIRETADLSNDETIMPRTLDVILQR